MAELFTFYLKKIRSYEAVEKLYSDHSVIISFSGFNIEELQYNQHKLQLIMNIDYIITKVPYLINSQPPCWFWLSFISFNLVFRIAKITSEFLCWSSILGFIYILSILQ